MRLTKNTNDNAHSNSMNCASGLCRILMIEYLLIAKWKARVAQWVRYLDYLTTHTSLSPIRRGFAPGFVL